MNEARPRDRPRERGAPKQVRDSGSREKLAPPRTTIALVFGLSVAVAGYAVARAASALASPAIDPTGIVPNAPIAFFWRALTVGYAGGIAAFVAAVVALRRADFAARALAPALAIAALLLATQALFWP
jgi:hypothetical protein